MPFYGRLLRRPEGRGYNKIALQGLLISCNQMSADYLFQRDKHYDVSYDTGDKVIQCGRHNDIFKFWLMWRAGASERTRGLRLQSSLS